MTAVVRYGNGVVISAPGVDPFNGDSMTRSSTVSESSWTFSTPSCAVVPLLYSRTIGKTPKFGPLPLLISRFWNRSSVRSNLLSTTWVFS